MASAMRRAGAPAVVLLVVVLVVATVVALTTGPAQGAFPGANGEIVLTESGGTTDHLVLMAPDGSGRRRVLDAPELSTPRWSADGTRIVYARATDDRSSVYLEVSDADGSDPEPVTDAQHVDRSPVFSPDGTRIAFSRMEDVYQDLYVIDVDGTNLQRITNTDAFDEKPTSWSPDGSTILFDSVRSKAGHPVVAVFAISPDGSDERQVTPDVYEATGGDFSPDGQRIVFTSEDDDGRGQLHTAETDGSDIRQLSHEDTGVENGAWSPDGTQIVAELTSMAGNPPSFSSQLGIVDARDGTLVRAIPRDRGNDESPNWQPIVGPPPSGPPVTDGPTTSTTTVVAPVVDARPAPVVTRAPRLTG